MDRSWIAVVALCGALLGACAQLNASSSATEPEHSEAAAACYVQNDVTGAWDHALPGWTEEGCFQSDSCFGGLGDYSPACRKWAMGPNAPPLPWPAETPALERVIAAEDQIPLEHGLFVVRHPCEAGPCSTRWRADARVPLYEEPDQFSRRVSRLRVDEVVSATEQIQYVPARRGVRRAGEGPLLAGDVVYALWGHCKGFDVWRRGEIIYSDEDLVDWDPPQRLYNSRAGDWVRFERANGQAGWARANVLGTHLTAIDPRPQPEATAEDEFDECE